MVEVLGPQPHLFVVDDSVACSVFPEAFATDDARRGEILAIVKELNADEFPKRQEASARLEQMGVTAAAVLATLDRASMPPEQAARVDAIISRIKPPYDADVKVLRNDPGFLLDCLLSGDVAVQKIALSQLGKVTGQEIPYITGQDEAARFKAVYELRARLLPTASPEAK